MAIKDWINDRLGGATRQASDYDYDLRSNDPFWRQRQDDFGMDPKAGLFQNRRENLGAMEINDGNIDKAVDELWLANNEKLVDEIMFRRRDLPEFGPGQSFNREQLEAALVDVGRMGSDLTHAKWDDTVEKLSSEHVNLDNFVQSKAHMSQGQGMTRDMLLSIPVAAEGQNPMLRERVATELGIPLNGEGAAIMDVNGSNWKVPQDSILKDRAEGRAHTVDNSAYAALAKTQQSEYNSAGMSGFGDWAKDRGMSSNADSVTFGETHSSVFGHPDGPGFGEPFQAGAGEVHFGEQPFGDPGFDGMVADGSVTQNMGFGQPDVGDRSKTFGDDSQFGG